MKYENIQNAITKIVKNPDDYHLQNFELKFLFLFYLMISLTWNVKQS